MKTVFSVKNQTGETWPAFGVARLGNILRYDGVHEEVPLYNLIKPDADAGIVVINGAADLPDGAEGAAVHYLGAKYVLVGDEEIAEGVQVGLVPGQWFAGDNDGDNGGQFLATDAQNEQGVAPVVPFLATGDRTSAPIIQFQPVDVCEGIGFICDCVTAIVVTASCGAGVNPGDEVQVWDQSRGWFQMPESLLFSAIGWAHKVKVTETDQYSLPFPIGPCRWVVFAMDCVEQEPIE